MLCCMRSGGGGEVDHHNKAGMSCSKLKPLAAWTPRGCKACYTATSQQGWACLGSMFPQQGTPGSMATLSPRAKLVTLEPSATTSLQASRVLGPLQELQGCASKGVGDRP